MQLASHSWGGCAWPPIQFHCLCIGQRGKISTEALETHGQAESRTHRWPGRGLAWGKAYSQGPRLLESLMWRVVCQSYHSLWQRLLWHWTARFTFGKLEGNRAFNVKDESDCGRGGSMKWGASLVAREFRLVVWSEKADSNLSFFLLLVPLPWKRRRQVDLSLCSLAPAIAFRSVLFKRWARAHLVGCDMMSCGS